jgi:hypothetical protein
LRVETSSGSNRGRIVRKIIGTVTAATAASGVVLLSASAATAAPPEVVEFPVSFPDTCAGSPDQIRNDLVVRRAVKTLPDGTVHYFLDVKGTVTNVNTGSAVRVHAARRFTDDAASDASRFAGLQVRFSTGGHGVLHMNAGRASGPLSQPLSDWTGFEGRWDGLAAGLPPSVCRVLVGP